MTSATRVGRIIGMLLLAHLATGLIVPYVLLQPLTKAPAGFLETAAGMSAQVRFYVLLLFVGGAISVGISVAAWPIIRQRSYRLGLWLLVLAVVNFTLQIIENSHWLSMLSLSQAYAEAGAGDARLFLSLGMVIRAAWKWAHYSHILVVVGWLFTLFCLLFRCAMVPRALAGIGMVFCVSQFVGITLPTFAGYRMPYPEFFGMPLGVLDIVLAVWLMANGFRGPDARTGADVPRVDVPRP